MKISFFFAWYDLWVGIYYDAPKGIIYVCPLPCCVVKFKTPIRIIKHTDCWPTQWEVKWLTDEYWHYHMGKKLSSQLYRCIKMQINRWSYEKIKN